MTSVQAIFFGQPEFNLKPMEDGGELWATGETIDFLSLTIRYSPTQSVSVVDSPPRAAGKQKDQSVDPEEEVAKLELGFRPGSSPQTGKVLEAQWSLLGRVDSSNQITAQLSVERVIPPGSSSPT